MSAFNLPITLTWFRIIAIPLVAIAFYLPFEWGRPVSAALFILAGLTDWLDGWLARRWNQTTPFGAFLDPVADKLIVAIALVILVHDAGRMPIDSAELLLTATAAVIIGREITVSALREWMAHLGARARVAVSPIGKSKTIVQMVGISMMLFSVPLMGVPIYELGFLLLLAAAVITLWSMFDYLRAAWPELRASTRMPDQG